MQLLRREERMVLELSFEQGMSQSEIAAATKLPLGTVKTHARRGMIRLRELLEQNSADNSKGNPNEQHEFSSTGPESSFLAAVLCQVGAGHCLRAALQLLEKVPAAAAGFGADPFVAWQQWLVARLGRTVYRRIAPAAGVVPGPSPLGPLGLAVAGDRRCPFPQRPGSISARR